MASLTCIIEPDEFQGLNALVELDKAVNGRNPETGTESDAVGKAKALMRTALAGKLQEAGLPWAPSAEAAHKCAAEAEAPARGVRRVVASQTARKAAVYTLAAALLVLLWGGYLQRWQWTGLPGGGQVWDWFRLLLLPIVLGTIPLWIQYKDYIGKGRRVIYAAVAVAWTGFMLAGYLIPIKWAGFRGQTLNDWLGLLVLPAAVAAAVTLFHMSARGVKLRLRPYQTAIIAALAAGLIVTIIGGYALHWTWTGYEKNDSLYSLQTLWDWLQMFLPLAFPIILLPPLVKWVSGNAAGRASAALDAAAARTATDSAAGPISAALEAAARTATDGGGEVNGGVSRLGLWSIPGTGVLARQGDLIVLAAIDERGLVERLLDSLAKASEGGDDGRRFADAVEDLVESDETWGGGQDGPSGPAVIAIGPAGAALAVMVSGTAWAEITTAHGTDRLVAGQPAEVLRCVIADPVHAVRGGLGTGRGTGDRTDRFSRLERGSVRAGGLSYHLGVPAAHLDLPAAPPQGAAGPAAVAPPAHDAGAPDGASPDSAAAAGAAASGPAAGEAAGARPRPSPVPPPRQPDAAEAHPTEPETAEPEEAESGTAEPAAGKAPAPAAKEPAAGKAKASGAEEPVAGEPQRADSGTAEPEAVEPAVVEPAAPPQADPIRPATEKAHVIALGADPIPAPTDAAVPAQQAADPVDAPPLPPAGASKDGTGAAVGAPLVLGVYCKNGHFGDPQARTCAVCGTRMHRRGAIPQPGPRPPLGALILDDESDSGIELSADCVIGRNPAHDPSVIAGEARPLFIPDPQVSRIHARVHLDGWQVVLIDLGSANGTRIQPPRTRSDQVIEPNVPVPLQRGTRVFVGTLGFRYDYPRGHLALQDITRRMHRCPAGWSAAGKLRGPHAFPGPAFVRLAGPTTITERIHVPDHLVAGRPGSAAKNADAVRRISFARRSSAFSLFSRLISVSSPEVTPGRLPSSTSDRRRHRRSVSGPMPSLPPT